jgi:methionine synthase I (cobalamin-dependent)
VEGLVKLTRVDCLSAHSSLDDFWSKENCSEVLVLSPPDIIKDIHAAYFKPGANLG